MAFGAIRSATLPDPILFDVPSAVDSEDEPLERSSKLRHISPKNLDAMLAQAHAAQWAELVLLGPRVRWSEYVDTWPDALKVAPQGFQLSEPVQDLAGRLYLLTQLTSLNLRGNQIGDDGAKAIASLTGLTSLNLCANQIGDDGAKAIASLTGLTSLDLRGNRIGDDGAKAIASLTGLTSLKLNTNQIGEDGVNAIARLTVLTSLYLRHNQIGVDGAKAIASLTGLTSLDLRDNRIGVDGAKAIASLTGLTSLDLRCTQIGLDGAKALLEAWVDPHRIGRLAILNLQENGDLSAILPVEALYTSDAQAMLAAYRAFRQADAT